MQYNILIDENIPYLAQALGNCGKVGTFSGRSLTSNQIRDFGCNILFVRSTTRVNKELLDGTDVKFVATATSGTDHTDTNYLSENNIAFYSAGGSNANSVAEYVIYSILLWICGGNLSTRDITVGIIGYGNIGRLVSKYCNLLGLRVLLNDPPLKDSGFDFHGYAEYKELQELLSESNIITNHVPFVKGGKYNTFHLIGTREAKLIKHSSLIIHTSRGGVVSEKSLDSISGKDINFAIDVWENEPLVDRAFASICMIATPHIAGYSRDGKIRGTAMMADAFRKFTGITADTGEIDEELAKYNPLAIEAYQNPDEILALLRQNRKLGRDQYEFLQTLAAIDKERAALFDKLRKEYPERRETL
jgi:erythronate-4-phosphate dehydrogenase